MQITLGSPFPPNHQKQQTREMGECTVGSITVPYKSLGTSCGLLNNGILEAFKNIQVFTEKEFCEFYELFSFWKWMRTFIFWIENSGSRKISPAQEAIESWFLTSAFLFPNQKRKNDIIKQYIWNPQLLFQDINRKKPCFPFPFIDYTCILLIMSCVPFCVVIFLPL